MSWSMRNSSFRGLLTFQSRLLLRWLMGWRVFNWYMRIVRTNHYYRFFSLLKCRSVPFSRSWKQDYFTILRGFLQLLSNSLKPSSAQSSCRSAWASCVDFLRGLPVDHSREGTGTYSASQRGCLASAFVCHSSWILTLSRVNTVSYTHLTLPTKLEV